jgi:hypothetical protein
MKTQLQRTLIIIVGLFLLSAVAVNAQQPQAKNLSQLKDFFDKLLSFPISDASSETRQLHLLVTGKAYDQYAAAIDNELKVLKNLLEAAGNSAPDVVEMVAKEIKHWEEIQKKAKNDFQQFSAPPGGSTSTGAATSSGAAGSFTGASAFAGTGTGSSNVSSSGISSSGVSSNGVSSNGVSSSGGSSGAGSSNISSNSPGSSGSTNNSSNTPVAAAGTAKVCGQLSLASLSKVLALINAAKSDRERIVEALGNIKDEKEKKAKEESFAIIEKILGEWSDLHRSRLGDACEPETWRRLGEQKRSVIRLLRAAGALLPELKSLGVTGANDPDASRYWLQKQIVLLEEYTNNVAVHVRNEKGKLIKTDFTDKDGNYSFEIPVENCSNTTEEKNYTITTEGDNHYTKREFVPQCDKPVRVNLLIEDRPVSLLTRAVVGYQQTGAAASGREQNFFFDFFASKSFPFIQRVNPHFGEKLKVWGAIRVSSAPQSGDVTIGTLSTNFVSNVSNLPVKDAARVFDFLTGVEILLTGNNALLPSFDRKTRMKFALSFIASGGAITPEEPKDKLISFKFPAEGKGLPDQIKALVADPKNTDFLTFVPKDRDRFFRQYYAGFRIQSFFFNNRNVPIQRFPAQLDLTMGQNEYVSGGRFRGSVFRIDGYFPLPYEELRFINLFGTAILRPGGVNISNPLVLESADGVKLGSRVAMIPFEQFNRDYYKAGIGIDFIDFVGKLKEKLK